jgi:hypothetical protein
MLYSMNRNEEAPRRLNGFSRPGMLSAACLFLSMFGTSHAEQKSDDFPPPLKTISESERAQLQSSRNISEELRRANVMMQARLTSAESAIAGGDEIRAFFELGAFHGLMDHILERLLIYDEVKRTSSQISNLKRFEITLRGYPARIELIRRRSFEFDSYILSLQRDIRDARAKALEPMFLKTQ